MTRIYATARKLMTLSVIGQTVVVRTERQSRSRTFRNRYTLRKFLTSTENYARKAGYVSVNR